MINDVGTVFAAEFLRRVRSRPFLIAIVIGLLVLTGITKLPGLINKMAGGDRIVVTGSDRIAGNAAKLLEQDYKAVIVLPNAQITPELLASNDAKAAIQVGENQDGLTVQVYAKDPASESPAAIKRTLMPLQLELATHLSANRVSKISDFPITVKPLASHFTSSDQATAARGIAYTLILFLYFMILVNSQLVMSSVVEEKTSRIAEMLVAAVEPSALLTGKILAGAALALLQMGVWIVVSIVLGGSGDQAAIAAGTRGDSSQFLSLAGIFNTLTPAVITAFFIFFVLGFLQLSTLMAGFASLINRTEDLGSISLPLVAPVIAAFFIAMVTLDSPDANWAVISSMVPIVSPFVMFARISVSNVPMWQVLLSLGINAVALYLITITAGKIYRVGMLLYGRTPKLSQVWHVLRS